MTLRDIHVAQCDTCSTGTYEIPSSANTAAALFLAGWHYAGEGKHACPQCIKRALHPDLYRYSRPRPTW